ncbi:hypothetical protein [Thermophilibacter sp.]
MALRWDEARLVVTCGEMPSEEERDSWGDDFILCTLRPEEVDDPETIQTVRDFVFERTLQARRDRLEELLDPDAGLPEPEATEPPEGAGSEAAEREEHLLESLRSAEGDGGDGGGAGFDDLGLPADGSLERGMWLEGGSGTGARIFVGHVEELVVHN